MRWFLAIAILAAACSGGGASLAPDASPDARLPPEGRLAVWSMGGAGSQHFGTTTYTLVPTSEGAAVVAAYVVHWNVGPPVFSIVVYTRDNTVTSPSDVGVRVLRADQGTTVLALVSERLPGDTRVQVDVIDTTTATITSTLTVAGLDLTLTDAVRSGAGFMVATASTAWLVDASGEVLDVVTWRPQHLRGFFRDGSDQILGQVDGAGGPEFWVGTLPIGAWSRAVIPAGLTETRILGLEAGRRVWVRGVDAAGRHVVAPLGGVVGTVLPSPGAVTEVDAQGRLLVVTADGFDRQITAVRLDDALFDGVDGASRIDPRYAGDGVAELVACVDRYNECDQPIVQLVDLVVASDGSIMVTESRSSFDGMWTWGWRDLWWFDPP